MTIVTRRPRRRPSSLWWCGCCSALVIAIVLSCGLARRHDPFPSPRRALEWFQELLAPRSHSMASTATTTTTHGTSSDNNSPTDPVLAASLQRTSGDGWKINPEPHHLLQDYECQWIDFISTTGQRAKFCGHSGADGVTNAIKTFHRFRHCNILPQMWNEAPHKTPNSVYLEIGANIGSCVMEMLLSTDAKIIAFEPHPKNQFVLMKSIAALNQTYQDRVTLVPVALGAASATNTIYAAKGNMGNSVVGQIIKDYRQQEFDPRDQFTIRVERLDSILSPDINVPFVKMDAQGFECNVLEGMGDVLPARVRRIKFELAKNFLNQQGCLDLLSRFRNKGYHLYSQDLTTQYETGEHTQFKRMKELVAVRE